MAKSTNVRVPATYGTVTNTIVETTLGTVTLSANSVKVDQKIRIECLVKCTATNDDDTFSIKLKLGSTVLSTVAAADVANNDCEFVIFTGFIDADAELLHGVALDGRTGAALANPEPSADVAFDVQTDKVFTVTGTWSVADAGNSAILKTFTVETNPV